MNPSLRPRRILHMVGSKGFAGSEQMVLNIAGAQRRAGMEVSLALRENSLTAERARLLGIPVATEGLGSIQGLRELVTLIKYGRVEVLHTHLTKAAYSAWIASLLTRVPVVVHAHVYNKDPVFRWAARRGRMVAVSESARNYYRGIGVPDSRIVVVPNGSDIERTPGADLTQDAAKQTLAPELDLDPSVPWVLHAGRFTHQKGQDLLAEAAPAILEGRSDAVFVFAGLEESGEFTQGVKASLASSGVLEKCRFAGLRSDLPAFYRAADVLVVPSRFDPYPLGVIEPLLLGVPLVAARVGGIPEIVTGFAEDALIGPENAEELARIVLCELHDPESRKRAEGRRGVARQKFSMETMVQNLDRVYNEVLA